MSLALYTTALVWRVDRGGVAKLWGRESRLTGACPLNGTGQVVMIEYRPEIGERRLQLAGEQPREMHLDEIKAADEFLLSRAWLSAEADHETT